MKVPPPQNLIVRAIPPQSIARHFVLAAAAVVLVLCGAASAQSAPAAPPLSLWNAVEISRETAADATATLEHSPDLQLWQSVAAPVYGGGELTLLAPAGAEAQGFYRLKIETRPSGGDSRWDMTGARLLYNTAVGVRSLSLGENGAGIMDAATGQMTFTWEWLRTGRDTGLLTTTWPDGVVETTEMEFTELNAGAFTSERMKEGVPAGAVCGSFRDEASAALAVAVPVAPGDATIVLAGTGRPVSVVLSAAGTARISSPSGARDFSASYVLTGAATAELSLSCEDGSTESGTLTFTGPACGSFEMHSKLNGRLRRSGGGAFTIATRQVP